MNANDCDMPNGSNVALFLGQWEVLWVLMGTKLRIRDFVVMVILEIKFTVFTCLLSCEGCSRFPKHLGVALAPNKTSEGIKKR